MNGKLPNKAPEASAHPGSRSLSANIRNDEKKNEENNGIGVSGVRLDAAIGRDDAGARRR